MKVFLFFFLTFIDELPFESPSEDLLIYLNLFFSIL